MLLHVQQRHFSQPVQVAQQLYDHYLDYCNALKCVTWHDRADKNDDKQRRQVQFNDSLLSVECSWTGLVGNESRMSTDRHTSINYEK